MSERCSSNRARSLAAKGTAIFAPSDFVLKYLEHFSTRIEGAGNAPLENATKILRAPLALFSKMKGRQLCVQKYNSPTFSCLLDHKRIAPVSDKLDGMRVRPGG